MGVTAGGPITSSPITFIKMVQPQEVDSVDQGPLGSCLLNREMSQEGDSHEKGTGYLPGCVSRC